MDENYHTSETTTAKSRQTKMPHSHGENELSILQQGNRIQITADIDLEGIAELKDILGHYEEILKRLAARKPSPTTGVSFLITHYQKAELRERGFTDDQIHAMTPEEAHRLLGLGD